MDYRTFIEMMKEQVQKHLGKDYEVQITTNSKLNGTEKTGLSISRTQEPPQVVPVLYLEECFERYLQDGGFAECVEEICAAYKNQKESEEKIMENNLFRERRTGRGRWIQRSAAGLTGIGAFPTWSRHRCGLAGHGRCFR